MITRKRLATPLKRRLIQPRATGDHRPEQRMIQLMAPLANHATEGSPGPSRLGIGEFPLTTVYISSAPLLECASQSSPASSPTEMPKNAPAITSLTKCQLPRISSPAAVISSTANIQALP